MRRKCMIYFKNIIADFISVDKYKYMLEDISNGIALLDITH